MSDEMDRLIVDNNYLLGFGHSKVTLEIEVESRMNYDKIYFSYKEIQLNYCYEVFKYYHENKDNFSYSQCARDIGISYHNVKKIFDKYLKEQ